MLKGKITVCSKGGRAGKDPAFLFSQAKFSAPGYLPLGLDQAIWTPVLKPDGKKYLSDVLSDGMSFKLERMRPRPFLFQPLSCKMIYYNLFSISNLPPAIFIIFWSACAPVEMCNSN
jgi:hypothetical protein